MTLNTAREVCAKNIFKRQETVRQKMKMLPDKVNLGFCLKKKDIYKNKTICHATGEKKVFNIIYKNQPR